MSSGLRERSKRVSSHRNFLSLIIIVILFDFFKFVCCYTFSGIDSFPVCVELLGRIRKKLSASRYLAYCFLGSLQFYVPSKSHGCLEFNGKFKGGIP